MKSSHLSDFVNKVVLKDSMLMCSHIAYGCFLTTVIELSGYHRDLTSCED